MEHFAYGAHLSELIASGVQCPPISAAPKALTAWRWVASPLSEQCFSPVAVRNPPRLIRESDPQKKCSCWGLSLHTSEQKSISAFKNLESSFKQARKTFGGYVAEVTITPKIGVCTVADGYGHFDLHQYATAKILPQVLNVNPIP